MFRILYRRESINHIQSIKTAYIRKTDTRMQLFVWFINWPSTLGLISDIYSVNSHSFGWVSWTEWVIGSDINTAFFCESSSLVLFCHLQTRCRILHWMHSPVCFCYWCTVGASIWLLPIMSSQVNFKITLCGISLTIGVII